MSEKTQYFSITKKYSWCFGRGEIAVHSEYCRKPTDTFCGEKIQSSGILKELHVDDTLHGHYPSSDDN
jgi:hypothetical protein